MTDIAFFITGAPRSGTKWLANLLNEAEGVRVYHEPLMRDAKIAMGGNVASVAEAVTFLRERKPQMVTPGRWGEVNHYLRHWVEPLRTVFPDAPIVGLIRDGKKAVNSMVHRRMYARRTRLGLPAPPDEAMGQLAKCCWCWSDTYKRLIEQRVLVFRLESLNEDYYVCETLCVTLGIKPVPEEIWKKYAGQPIHSSELAVAQEWTPERCAVFDKWAGNMQKLFYHEG